MNQQRDGRLGIGIIGAGKVGPILGVALAGAGHALVGVSAVSETSKERASDLMPDVPILDVPVLVERSELVLIAVPDDQLEGLIDGLSATGAWQPGQIVLHTSAQFGIEVFSSALAAGVIPVALHPIMDFTGTSIDLARLADCFIAVSAPGPVLPIAQALAVELGGEPVVISPEQRLPFALAVASARSFSNNLVDESAAHLSDAGISAPAKVIAPLIRSTVENAIGRYPDTSAVFPELDGLL